MAGTVFLAATTLIPASDSPPLPHLCLLCGELGGVDVVLNIALFFPVGIGLGLRRFRGLPAVTLVITATALIEFLQLTVVPGRNASLSDLLTNTLGGTLGYLVGTRWPALVSPSIDARRRLLVAAATFFALIEILTGYSLQLAPTDGAYYGHFTREYDKQASFPGSVSAAWFGQCSIRNWNATDGACIRDAVVRGDTFGTALATRGHAEVPTSIVRIVDYRQREIANLGAHNNRALFSVRTKAEAMKLRPYFFALDSAFLGDSQPAVRLVGQFHPSAATIRTDQPGGMRQAEIRLGPASGWKLFLPFRYYDDGSPLASAFGMLWLAVLLFPVGYWLLSPVDARFNMIPLILVGIGLTLCAVLFRTAAPSPGEAFASIAGIVGGHGARTLVERVRKSPAKVESKLRRD